MTSSSSSSTATRRSSKSSTSESKQGQGFEFNGTVYPTYNEMVLAKRERNRRFLEEKLSEVASFAAAASKKSDASQNSFDISMTSAASSANTGNKRKRSLPAGKYQRSNSNFSVDLPLRRNPRRLSSMAASYTDCDDDEDEGVKKTYSSPTSTRPSSSYASDVGKRYRRMKSGHRIGDEKSHVSTDNSAVSANLYAGRFVHATAIHIPRPGPPANPCKTYPKVLKLKTPEKRSRQRGPAAHDLLPKHDIKELAATLEHVILNGFRIRNRESVWRDFYTSGCASGHVGNNEQRKPSDLIDRELYAALNGDIIKTHDNEDCMDSSTFNESDDDNLIPKEYLLPQDKCDSAKTVNSESFVKREGHNQCQKKPAIKSLSDVSLMQNNMDCDSKGPDQCWDHEFGDGYDPMLFVDECRGYKAEDSECEDETTMDSHTDRQYTARLLQTCWERAVHAVSSTITVHLSEKQVDKCTPDGLVENDEGADHLKEQRVDEEAASATIDKSKVSATSFLHREALNVVESVMDLLLLEKNGLFGDMTNSEGSYSRKCVQWYDVFQLLQSTVQSTKINAIDHSSIDATRQELSKDGEALTSKVLRFVDRTFHETTDLNTISVADVISSVSKHFGFSSIEKSMKKAIRERLRELLNGDVQAKATSKVGSCVVDPSPAPLNGYPIVSGSSYSTIQINENRCPIPLNESVLKAITVRLIERYGSVSHKFPS